MTKYGEAVCDFSEAGKQPYEVILIGRKMMDKSGTTNSENIIEDLIPKDSVIISTPSAIHSHKPPLSDIINTFVLRENGESKKKLEIFGRYLLSGWTTVGDEVTKLQSVHLFDELLPESDERTAQEQ